MGYKKVLAHWTARLAEKWPAKVTSVVVAIIFFAFHRMGELQERFFSVPLRVDLDSGLTPGSSYPRNIRVSLRGDPNSIYHIAEEDIEAYLDLTAYSEGGTYRAPVRVSKKGTAAEVEALEISLDPVEITLELDARASKYVPLAPDFRGYLESGYEMVSYTLEPNQVVIEGPQKILGGIAELSTDSVDLRGRSGDFSARVRIINPSPLVLVRGDGMTEFQAFIRGLIAIASFEDLPVNLKGLDPSLRAEAEPPAGSARIQGEQRTLDALDTAAILGVDCSALAGPGTYELPLEVSVPEGLAVDRREPETIRLTVRRSGE
ncbi:MAG: hypothetical protein LBD09_01825 [Treponema sp.]|nr:hypothetical protein [Treponema sp.]